MIRQVVLAIVKEKDSAIVGVYTDPSEARVRLIYIEEETKQPHRIVPGLLTLGEEVPNEVVYSVPANSSTGGSQ